MEQKQICLLSQIYCSYATFYFIGQIYPFFGQNALKFKHRNIEILQNTQERRIDSQYYFPTRATQQTLKKITLIVSDSMNEPIHLI